MSKLDIGVYADDTRLVEHGEQYASFYGERCSPAVTVVASGDGFQASQHRSETRWNRDGGGMSIAEMVLLAPTKVAYGATAAEALVQIIGKPLLDGAR